MFDFADLTVVAEAFVGSDWMFIWDSTAKNGIRGRNAFDVGLDKKDQLRLSAVSSATDLQALVLDAFMAAQTKPEAYKPLQTVHTHYQYLIPLTGRADTSEHPVFFEFDGSSMDFPLSDMNVKPPSPLMEFFRNASQAHLSGKDELYASFFTSKSQMKVREWLASTRSSRERMRQQQRGGFATLKAGNVKFVISADPVFLIFEAPMAGNTWGPENLTYSYAFHEGGTYKATNFAYLSLLDDFLQNPALFDNRFLKPAASKAKAP